MNWSPGNAVALVRLRVVAPPLRAAAAREGAWAAPRDRLTGDFEYDGERERDALVLRGAFLDARVLADAEPGFRPRADVDALVLPMIGREQSIGKSIQQL